MFTYFFRFTLLLLTFVVLFATCGEDDNPVADADNDHADADGFILKVDGERGLPPISRDAYGKHRPQSWRETGCSHGVS